MKIIIKAMKQMFFTTTAILVFCFSVFSQSDQSVCPKTFSIFPNSLVTSEDSTKIAVDLNKKVKDYLKYEWTVSAGSIIKGQETPEIELAVLSGDVDNNIIVSLKISGLSKTCSISDFFVVAPIIGCIFPIDEFGKVNLNDFKVRLDSFLVSVMNNADDDEGLIIIKFNNEDTAKYKKAFLKTARKHIEFRKFDLTRITFAVSEDEFEEKTTFRIIPPGGEFPTDTNYKIVKAEDLEQTISELFPKK